ncbi:Alpha/Beta hydrolase protein [Paraphoma chrysanthemicola]|nr:Alpha/Beta hydrolase protein [Paraphoma chrysanthemicola]
MANLMTVLLSTSVWGMVCALDNSTGPSFQLPVVDLGYAVHLASFNSTGNYYNFSNIRYAEPPLGSLRFAAPVPPRGRNLTIDDGSIARICPQAYPSGAARNQVFNTHYSRTGKTGLEDFENATQGFDYPRNTPQDPRATEDCLFLDLMVPREVFNRRYSKGQRFGRGAAVMVWIHGGGYAAGTKFDTPPAGLISRSQDGGREGIIYVSINYRLGALGWLSGPSFAVDGTANAGFYDQRLALEWVRDNIYRFGGDPNRVTVFGESAGGGSIAYQIAAYGGERGPVPFQRAILESPGYTPTTGNLEQEENFREYLSLMNVSTLDEARRLPSSVIQAANELQVRTSRPGSFSFGPAVDGVFVPELLSLLFLHGRFHHSVETMVGHNGDEGVAYPVLRNDQEFEAYVTLSFPNAPSYIQRYISQKLYPPVLETSGDVLEDYDPMKSEAIIVTGYNTALGRQSLFTSETVINCLTHYVNKAFRGRTYSYVFGAPPALHGQELYYVFYNEQATDIFFRPLNRTLAHIIQDYWMNFAKFGDPNGEGLPHFSRWGNDSNVQELSLARVGPRPDPLDSNRCGWWQLGLYV